MSGPTYKSVAGDTVRNQTPRVVAVAAMLVIAISLAGVASRPLLVVADNDNNNNFFFSAFFVPMPSYASFKVSI